MLGQNTHPLFRVAAIEWRDCGKLQMQFLIVEYVSKMYCELCQAHRPLHSKLVNNQWALVCSDCDPRDILVGNELIPSGSFDSRTSDWLGLISRSEFDESYLPIRCLFIVNFSNLSVLNRLSRIEILFNIVR